MTMSPLLSFQFEQLQTIGIVLHFQDVAFGRHDLGLVDPPQLAPVPRLRELDLQDPGVKVPVYVCEELLQRDDLMGSEDSVNLILFVIRPRGPGRHEQARRQGHAEHCRARRAAARDGMGGPRLQAPKPCQPVEMVAPGHAAYPGYILSPVSRFTMILAR